MKSISVFKEIKHYKRWGFNKRQTALELDISRGTVNKYWDMEIGEYNRLHLKSQKSIQLSQRQNQVERFLRRNRSASARQIHQMLLGDGIDCSERTTARFVREVRWKLK